MEKINFVRTLGNFKKKQEFQIEKDEDGDFDLSEIVKDADVDGNTWFRKELLGCFKSEDLARNQLYDWYMK